MFVLSQNLEDVDRLFQRDQVPSVFWEVGIFTGYRKPHSSLKECLRSAFRLNNETLNFWTHFLPFWYFVWVLRDFCADENFVSSSYNWPFIAYLLSVSSYPAVSCFAHLFSAMSENVRHICFFLDYMSLSTYSMGVAIAYHAYCFDELFFNTWYSGSFLFLSAAAALFCTTLACQSRFVQHPAWKKFLRVTAFVVVYMTISFPLIERILHCKYTGCDDVAIPQHLRQFIWAGTMIIIYALHIPECFAPGYFDLVGHSHQIFHVFAILASYDQMWACYTDLENRKELFLTEQFLPAGRWDAKLAIVVAVINTVIVAAFTLRLCCKPKGISYSASSTDFCRDDTVSHGCCSSKSVKIN